MADTLKRMYGPEHVASAAATIYTAPAGGAVLRYLIAVNTSGTDRTLTVSIGADAANRRIISARTIPASGGTTEWAGSIPLAAGETVQAYGSAAAAITLTLSGVETT